MNVFLTLYSTPTWQLLIKASDLKAIDGLPAAEQEIFAIQTPQTASYLAKLLEKSPNTLKIWVAMVQAEYFIAEALENNEPLENASQCWESLTNEILSIQRKHRSQIKLFNLHQALANPLSFRDHLADIKIKEYSPHVADCTVELLAASQCVRQQDRLRSLNILLQASSLPLCENEQLILDIDAALKKGSKNSTVLISLKNELLETSKERDLILAQLHIVQEELESYYQQLQAEKELHKKHLKNCKDKQSPKEIARLETELRKAKARAANAEFLGSQLQQELDKLKTSFSWKAAKPVRMIGHLLKKTDQERELLLQQIGFLLASEYFDAEWYLKTYTDVAESKMNPAEHYLLFGAKEGRLPSPLFDGNWYLQQYPDVAAANLNPLLHFIMHGLEEGRISSPKLLTNTQSAEERS